VVLSKIDHIDSGALWHRHVDHISNNRVKWLGSNGILDSINFTNFDVYVEWLKVKRQK